MTSLIKELVFQKDDGNRKGQIKLVSSLGEGKLLDKFQSSLNEKDKKKKSRERGDKMRKVHKEKRDRDIAKFKAEVWSSYFSF